MSRRISAATLARLVPFAALTIALSMAVGACGSSGSDHRAHASRAKEQVQRQQQRAERQRQRQEERARAQARAKRRAARRAKRHRQLQAMGCPNPSEMLKGVYHPDRLIVRDPCRRVSGTVDDVRDEEDGDIHILVGLESQYRGMLMANNRSEQDGDLVVEFMPRDYGHLPRPGIGDRITLTGAYVDDTEHTWAELHPVWAVSLNGGPVSRSGPEYGGSPPSALSSNALATCHTNTGARCHGYTGEVAPPPDDESGGEGGGGGGGTSASGGNCTPGYSPCLPPASDYDCEGGTGDGPKYTGQVRVTGSDPYGLDANHDGVGC